MKMLRTLLDILLHAIAVATMLGIVGLTAMHAATLQIIIMLLGTGLMTLAVAEQVAGK